MRDAPAEGQRRSRGRKHRCAWTRRAWPHARLDGVRSLLTQGRGGHAELSLHGRQPLLWRMRRSLRVLGDHVAHEPAHFGRTSARLDAHLSGPRVHADALAAGRDEDTAHSGRAASRRGRKAKLLECMERRARKEPSIPSTMAEELSYNQHLLANPAQLAQMCGATDAE